MSRKTSVIGIAIASYFLPLAVLRASHGLNGLVTANYAVASLVPFFLVTVPWYFLFTRRVAPKQ